MMMPSIIKHYTCPFHGTLPDFNGTVFFPGYFDYLKKSPINIPFRTSPVMKIQRKALF